MKKHAPLKPGMSIETIGPKEEPGGRGHASVSLGPGIAARRSCSPELVEGRPPCGFKVIRRRIGNPPERESGTKKEAKITLRPSPTSTASSGCIKPRPALHRPGLIYFAILIEPMIFEQSTSNLAARDFLRLCLTRRNAAVFTIFAPSFTPGACTSMVR